MSLTVIQKETIVREFDRLKKRIEEIEAMLQGQPITAVRIKDASIDNAKIIDLSADKITSGQLDVATYIDLGDESSGDYIRMDGGGQNIVGYRSDVANLVIGQPT